MNWFQKQDGKKQSSVTREENEEINRPHECNSLCFYFQTNEAEAPLPNQTSQFHGLHCSTA